MRRKIRCISFYFAAFTFLVFIGGCVSSGTNYFPKSLETTPITNLVKVIIPTTEKIVMIDGKKVSSAPTMYVSPGNHTYTFKIKYSSSTYCNGPLYGLKADRDFFLQNGEVSSVVRMEGKYEIDASANEGQTVEFIFQPAPDCKSEIEDYFNIVISQ